MSSATHARRRVLLVAAVLAVVLLMAVPAWNPAVAGDAGGRAAPAAAFLPNVLVNRGPGNAWVPSVAVDGGGKLHVAWSDDRSGSRKLYYSNSTDAGTTWSPDWEIGGAAATANEYDPAVAVDRSGGARDGSVYVVWRELVTDPDVYLRRSPDRGASWLPRVRVDGAPAGVPSTAPTVAVDATGQLFVGWADIRNASGLQVFVRRSSDGGATWSTETQVSQTPANNALATLAAGPGHAYVAWKEMVPATLVASLWVARTSDGGATWTNTLVDTGPAPTDRQAPQVYAGPDGSVHLIWIGSGASGITAIRASHSTDGGATWSAAARVDDTGVTPVVYRTPRVVSAGGDLFAVWADNRNGDMDIFYSVSRDNGATWGDGLPNSDARVDDTDVNPSSADDATVQDYPNAASDGYGVYAVWDDRRTNLSYQVYFARNLTQRVLITEFQDAPQGSEAIEIAAYAAAPISLAGYRLDIDGFPLDLTGLGTLAPGQHKVVGDPGWADIVYDITLGDEGGVLQLFDRLGALVDAVAYGRRGPVPDPIAGESASRGWTGTKYSEDWGLAAGPTWRVRNSAPAGDPGPTVVLNEVLFNPATPSDAFIELFYVGTASVNLAGYTIAGDAAQALPSATVSPADPYFILRTADAPALFPLVDAAGDNVYLYNATGAFLDEAGWSSPHTAGRSMARVPEGAGGHAGFDDPSSMAAGWRFDRAPTIPLVILRQDQLQYGDLGQVIPYPLTVVHKETTADILEIEVVPGPDGWAVNLTDGTGAPLQDHDGDGIPDTNVINPGTVFSFTAWVQVPSTPPVADEERVVIAAHARLTPLARSTVTLTTGTFPRIEPSASVDANPIYVVGSAPPRNLETNLTLTIAGRGTARVRRAPQDVVLLLDRSGSLSDAQGCVGCFPLLKDAAKTYVDNLTVPDTGTVIYFTDAVLYKGPLTPNYALIKAWIDSEAAPGGGTQIGEAIRAANNELIARGQALHFWAVILFTDGQDNPGGLDPLSEARTSASLGIRIFTIGLGPGADANLLGNIATLTGGVYLHADTPQDLAGIYAKVGTLIDNLAGFDSDLTDDLPMVEVRLPPYIVITTRPFVNPDTGGARPPDWRGPGPGGVTVLQWNVSALRVNQTWSVRFTIQSTRAGLVDAIATPASRAMYARWDGTTATLPFPRVPLLVLEQSAPTARYTITRSPVAGDVVVDGVPYPAPTVFEWYVGSRHNISVPSPDPAGTDARYLFQSWNDTGAQAHEVLVGTRNETITAFFLLQYLPSVRLVGTNPAHDVGVAFTGDGTLNSDRTYGTWTDWVDAGSRIAFDALAAGSGPDERRVTLEDFTLLPWSAVTGPFTRSVLYYHQYMLRVIPTGLPAAWPAPLAATAFGRTVATAVSAEWDGWIDESTDAGIAPTVTVSAVERYRTPDPTVWRGDAPRTATVRYIHQWLWRVALVGLDTPTHVTVAGTALGDPFAGPGGAPWSGWVDDGTPLSVDGMYMAGPRERYRARDPAAWTVDRAGDVTVRYVHEMRPSVLLVGTDDTHVVGVLVHTATGDRRIDGLFGSWTDWIETGATLAFDNQTSGSPPRTTRDATAFDVRTPFDGTVVYAAALEVNLKPFFAAIYAAFLVAIGVTFARRRPIAFAGSRRSRERRPEDTRARVTRDRRKTALLLVLPVAAVEVTIGVASYFTGVLRIPEGGAWLSLGLLVNTVILATGIGSQVMARRKGYDAAADLAKARRNAARPPAGTRTGKPPPPSSPGEAVPPPPDD